MFHYENIKHLFESIILRKKYKILDLSVIVDFKRGFSCCYLFSKIVALDKSFATFVLKFLKIVNTSYRNSNDIKIRVGRMYLLNSSNKPKAIAFLAPLSSSKRRFHILSAFKNIS